jgi:hypothetical protein
MPASGHIVLSKGGRNRFYVNAKVFPFSETNFWIGQLSYFDANTGDGKKILEKSSIKFLFLQFPIVWEGMHAIYVFAYYFKELPSTRKQEL